MDVDVRHSRLPEIAHPTAVRPKRMGSPRALPLSALIAVLSTCFGYPAHAQIFCPDLDPANPQDCGGFCDEGAGAGECIPTPSDCPCVVPQGGDNPPGDGCNASVIEWVDFGASGDIAPGAVLQLVAQVPATMRIANYLNDTTAELQSATVQISISATVTNGRSHVAVTGGQGAIGPFQFGFTSIGASTFTISGGSGQIEWATGIFTADMYLRGVAPALPPILVHALGMGRIDSATDTVTLQGGGSFDTTANPVPALSAWAALALGVLLVTSGVRAMARRRPRLAA